MLSEPLYCDGVSDAGLRQLAQEVLDVIKTTAGVATFTSYYAAVQKSLTEKKETRKKQKAAEVGLLC